MLNQQINQFLTQNSGVLYLLVAINILLIIFAPFLISYFSDKDLPEGARDFRINVVRGLNVLVIGLLGHFRFYSEGQSGQGIGIKILSIPVSYTHLTLPTTPYV